MISVGVGGHSVRSKGCFFFGKLLFPMGGVVGFVHGFFRV